MTPTTAPLAYALAKDADLSLLEFLALTGGIPPNDLGEVVGDGRQRWLENLDPDDSPF